jgi:hypothetical protein
MRHSKTRKSPYKTKRKTRRTRTRGKVLRGGSKIGNELSKKNLVYMENYTPSDDDFIYAFRVDFQDLYTDAELKQLSENEKKRLNSLNLYNKRFANKNNISELPDNILGVIESYRDQTIPPMAVKEWFDSIQRNYIPFESIKHTELYHPYNNQPYGTDFKIFAYEQHPTNPRVIIYYAKFKPNMAHSDRLDELHNKIFMDKGAYITIHFPENIYRGIQFVYNKKAYKLDANIIK